MSSAAVPAPPSFSPSEIGERCLVTGGAGYLGRALTERLVDQGCRVRTLDIQEGAIGHDAVDERVGDLRDFDAILSSLQGIDTVFHTAALISTLATHRAQPSLRRAAFAVNVVGTENMLRAARAAGVRAFVHTSSFNVVMDHAIEGGDEALPYATASNDLYTVTKVAAERAVLAADNPEGLRTIALRPAGIWGAGRGGMMLDAFVRELARGAFKATIGDGHTPLDNTHVENLVDAMLLAAARLRAPNPRVAGRAYFITDGERFDAMEWFRPLVEGLGHAFPSLRIPGALMLRVADGLELAHQLGAPAPTITRRGIRNLTEGAHFSIEAAARDLGYRPRYRREHLALLLPELQVWQDELTT